MRVRRQQFQTGAALFDEEAHLWGLVRLQVVKDHNISATEARRKAALHPRDEGDRVHRAPLGAEHDPAATANGADEREVIAPVHRPRFHIFFSALDPHMRAAHRQIRARFIDKHQSVRVLASHPFQECRALGCHIRPVDFARARTFFLSTNPARFSARCKLARVVRCWRGTRRLYSQHSSASVASGTARTTTWSMSISIGHGQPPPLGRGVSEPVVRHRATHRSSVRWSTSNNAASCAYDPSPLSYAFTARSRSATSYGLGMAPLKYTSVGNSSGKWD